MATATAKKAPAKKAPASKAAGKKAAPKKAAARKTNEFSVKDTADRVLNIYLGVIGTGVDAVQENIESRRKQNDKRVKELEKRGAKLRSQLNKRMDKIEVPAIDEVVDDVKEQFSKIQDQVEDVVENVKEKLTPAKAA
jgi:Mg2+ and Co2+ transporter CorA